jgi:hypothetical protein
MAANTGAAELNAQGRRCIGAAFLSSGMGQSLVDAIERVTNG